MGIRGQRRSPRRRHPDRERLLEAFERLLERPANFSHRRHGEALDRTLHRLDRYAHFGAKRRGAGLELAISLIAGQREEERWGDVTPVFSLAYFIPVLEETSRDWRRHEKARRRGQKSARVELALDPGDSNPQGGPEPDGR